MKCHVCGAEIQTGFAFCSHCGTKLPQNPPTPQAKQPKIQQPKSEWQKQILCKAKEIGKTVSTAFLSFLACLIRLKCTLLQKFKKHK